MHRTERPKTWIRLAAVGLLGGVAAFGAPSVEKGAAVSGEALAMGPNGAPIAATAAMAGAVVANTANAAFDPPAYDTGFVPFVLVRIPYDETTYSHGGEVLGVSDNGTSGDAIAVGYLLDGNDVPYPFMFTAKTNTLTILDLDGGTYDSGKATCISPDGSYIGGVAHETSSVDRAVVWDGGSSYSISATLGSSVESHWNCVNDGGTPVGAYVTSSHFESIVNDYGGPSLPETGSEGEARGINASEWVCGSYLDGSGNSRAYRWNSLSGDIDMHPTSGWDESGANCINNTADVGGWVESSGLKYPAHFVPVSIPAGLYTIEVFNPSADAEVVAVTSNKEMLINRLDGTPGVALWSHHGMINEAHGLGGSGSTDKLILTPNADDDLAAGRCMNNDLWVGGSYFENGTGDPKPCLAIPYDLDNNGVPDYRQIVDAGPVNNRNYGDEYGYRWLIDVAENDFNNPSKYMRVGLNQPGYTDTYTQQVAHNQVVRLQVGLWNPDFVTGTIGDDEYFVNGIVYTGGTSQCGPFEDAINDWTHYVDSNENDVGREVVIMLRSNLLDTDRDHDYLPDPSHIDDFDKEEALADLHAFSYKFAHCIDWVQLGNEAFDGSGDYKIYPDQLGTSGCWTGDPREFKTIPVSPASCFGDALDAVADWDHEQMWSIVEGSALAGRPLRIVGPAITMQTVDAGWNNDTTRAWNEVDRTITWCNEHKSWFDLHAHYIARADAEDAIQKVLVPGFQSHDWAPVDHRVCLEFSPDLYEAGGWWTGGASALFSKFLDMPDCNQNAGESWEDYIGSWQLGQFSGDSDFGLATLDYIYWADDFTMVCYGNTLQSDNLDPHLDLAAVRAQNVCEQYFDSGNTTSKFSVVIQGDYEDAAETYEIPAFNPHDSECDACGN